MGSALAPDPSFHRKARKVGGHVVTSHDPHPDRARPPGESQPASTEPAAQARTKRKDPTAGEPRPAQHTPAAGDASDQSARSRPLTRKTIVTRAVALAAAGLAIYLVLPSLTRVLASWPRLLTLDRIWLAVALAAELAPLRAPSPCSGWPCRRASGFPWSLPGWPATRYPASCRAAPRPGPDSSSRCSRTPGSTRTPSRHGHPSPARSGTAGLRGRQHH